MKRPTLLLSAGLLLVIWPVLYLRTQHAIFEFGRERISLVLTNPPYRSWSLDFSDGFTWDRAGRMIPIVIRKDGSTQFGRRLWPKFHHLCLDDQFYRRLTNGLPYRP